MLIRLLRAALPSVLACSWGLQLAHADIYTWIDKSGTINLSNLPPPEGVKVTKVIHESPPKTASPGDAADDPLRQPDVQALAERIRQLEQEVEFAKRPLPPPMAYPAVPAPPVPQYPSVQYQGIEAQPAVPYGAYAAQPANYGCDPSWLDCGAGWGPSLYPATVVVVGAPSFRRHFPFHGGHHFAMQRPVRGSGGLRRR